MKTSRHERRAGLRRWFLAVCLLFACPACCQNATGKPQLPSSQSPTPGQTDASAVPDRRAEAELQIGTNLTRQGLFADAIPHLLSARGHVVNTYAADFNLALCYVGSRQPKPAIAILEALRKANPANADVENLLAQAYIGDGQPEPAFDALRRAATLTPKNEKLYLFIADGCMDNHDYGLGLRVLDLALANLPESAQMHYERGVFYSFTGDMDHARQDFQAVMRLQPASDVSYLASAHEDLIDGDPEKAMRDAREGISRGYRSPNLMSMLAEALIRSGARPGDAEFSEAQKVLEGVVSERPRDANARTSLGKLYLLTGRVQDAITQLEVACKLEPRSSAVYASLAKAYRQNGDARQSQNALTTLEKLNQQAADKIASAPGDHRANYAGAGSASDGP